MIPPSILDGSRTVTTSANLYKMATLLISSGSWTYGGEAQEAQLWTHGRRAVELQTSVASHPKDVSSAPQHRNGDDGSHASHNLSELARTEGHMEHLDTCCHPRPDEDNARYGGPLWERASVFSLQFVP